MSKTIIVRIKRAGNRVKNFSIVDDLGNILKDDVSKSSLIEGITLIVEDYITRVILKYEDGGCCDKQLIVPVRTITPQEIADFEYSPKNTPTLWRHLTNPTIYNSFYGCISPYIIEYPFSYSYQDEIVQNVK